MNNSKRIVELLTKSADLMSALRRRDADTLWQRLHNENLRCAPKSTKSFLNTARRFK
jgi:hypothetical protein